jgi:hypothetical protein
MVSPAQGRLYWQRCSEIHHRARTRSARKPRCRLHRSGAWMTKDACRYAVLLHFTIWRTRSQ